jgi:hypothetical protein
MLSIKIDVGDSCASVAWALGKGGIKRLLRGGALRDDLSEKLYDFWQ